MPLDNSRPLEVEFVHVDDTWDGKVRIQYVFNTQEEALTWWGEHDPDKFWEFLEAIERRAKEITAK